MTSSAKVAAVTAPSATPDDAAAKVSEILIRPRRQETDPEGMVRRRRALSLSLGIGTPVLLLVLWQTSAQQSWIDTRFFPAPAMILTEAGEMVESGMLVKDVWASLKAILVGYALGLVAGVLTGTALALSTVVRFALEPLLSALYTIPKLAILPLLLLIFGLGELPKIILIMLGVFFVIWVSVLEGIEDAPPTYAEAAQIFGINGINRWVHVILPGILPNLFTGMRIALGTSVLIAVGTEFVNGDEGIGYRIWHSWSLFQPERMYVGIVVVAFMGFALTWIVKAIGALVAPWAPRQARRHSE
jgi:ABC-type nitrate/sulfonate/bicarbonate transport system permease component